MPLKLTYCVFDDEADAPVYVTGHKDDAIKWCRANYGRKARTALVITYHNPHSKAPLHSHAGVVKLPKDFQI